MAFQREDEWGDDESMQIVRALPSSFEGGHGGWIVLTRYKRRGRASGAVHVGDFHPARPVTRELCEAALEMHLANPQDTASGLRELSED